MTGEAVALSRFRERAHEPDEGPEICLTPQPASHLRHAGKRILIGSGRDDRHVLGGEPTHAGAGLGAVLQPFIPPAGSQRLWIDAEKRRHAIDRRLGGNEVFLDTGQDRRDV